MCLASLYSICWQVYFCTLAVQCKALLVHLFLVAANRVTAQHVLTSKPNATLVQVKPYLLFFATVICTLSFICCSARCTGANKSKDFCASSCTASPMLRHVQCALQLTCCTHPCHMLCLPNCRYVGSLLTCAPYGILM